MEKCVKVGDILIDKIVPSSRLLVIEKTNDGITCVFLDGFMEGKVVTLKNLFTYKKIGKMGGMESKEKEK